MKSFFLIIVVQILGLANPNGLAQDQSAALITKFEKDAALTDLQVQNVIQLAKTCGLTNPVEIAVHHTHPIKGRFFVVKSKDVWRGRQMFCNCVDVWWPKSGNGGPSAEAKQVGEFWVNPPYLQRWDSLTVHVERKQVAVQTIGRIPPETADRIFEAIAGKRVRFRKGPELSVDYAEMAQPKRLEYDPRVDEYDMLCGPVAGYGIRFKLKGDHLLIQEVHFVAY